MATQLFPPREGSLPLRKNVSFPDSDGKRPDMLGGEKDHLAASTKRPFTPRRSTDPSPSPNSSGSSSASAPHSPPSRTTMPAPYRPRNSSPFSRGHVRARSSASALTPPSMARAHSMPLVDTFGRVVMPASTAQRPPSPLSSSGRRVSPSRRSIDEGYACFGGPTLPGIGEHTTEFAEIPESASTKHLHTNGNNAPSSTTLPLSHSNSLTRRHRTSSPLRHLVQAPPSEDGPSSQPNPGSALASSSSSPLLSSTKYNESYPTSYTLFPSYSSTSSLPSTPTSARSRSPSISSLETIPDTPGGEEAALEAERIAELKAAADAADGEASPMLGDSRRRSSLDVANGGNNGGLKGTVPSMAWGYGSRDKRKRWSVCGAERRSDLDLETIWED